MKNVTSAIFVAVFLIFGLAAGAILFPTEKEVPVEVIKEVPVEVIKEVIKEVSISCPPCFFCKPSMDSVLQLSVSHFMAEVKDNDTLLECDGNSYDYSEISVSKVYDSYNITIIDENEYTVDFTVKLKYKESFEPSLREVYDVNVVYTEDEDPEVTVVIAD